MFEKICLLVLQSKETYFINIGCVVLALLMSFNIQAQQVKVPSVIGFADMRLELSPAAQKKIQTDVDALLRSEKFFLLKLKKIDAYFPLIEQALKEEKVPDDIKYLVIQESALVGDAVSTSNAIGYWQFKEAAAREVGLTINQAVDERMNIVTATRGAARYFKSNNTYFDNWLYALMAYYTGPGGALKLASKSQYGSKRMRLEGDTHWYVLKFLAHKVAFENAIGKNPRPDVQLFTYTKGKNKTLQEIAREFDLQTSDLDSYNRWLRTTRIPGDKTYHVIIPSFGARPQEELLAQTTPAQTEHPVSKPHTSSGQTRYTVVEDTRHFPVIEAFRRKGAQVKINGIPGVIAREGDDIRAIAGRSSVPASHIVAYNDLTSKESAVIPGEPYYIRKKRNRGAARYHVAQPGETLWSISQRFGMKLDKLLRNNRMQEEDEIQADRVLWLRYIRPASIPVEYRQMPGPQKATDAVTATKPVPENRPAKVKSEASGTKLAAALPETEETAKAESPRNTPAAKQETVNQTSYESWEAPDTEASAPAEKPTVVPTKKPDTNSKGEDSFQSAEVVFVEDKTEATLPGFHSVQPGETFYGIARKYDLSVAQLRQYNDLAPDATLKEGQKLRVSPMENQPRTEAEGLASREVYHEVQPGETMYQVARSYAVTIKDLMEWNDKDSFQVSVGERLKIVKPQQK